MHPIIVINPFITPSATYLGAKPCVQKPEISYNRNEHGQLAISTAIFQFFRGHPELVAEVKALSQQLTDTSLSLWNIVANHELAIDAHVVD